MTNPIARMINRLFYARPKSGKVVASDFSTVNENIDSLSESVRVLSKNVQSIQDSISELGGLDLMKSLKKTQDYGYRNRKLTENILSLVERQSVFKNYLSAVSIIKNEASYMPEWL